ncbi:MAG: ABC transporter ATP-binding protein [Treponema sp.]|nr:ABC transporter ATP-binding protein [Treponema sp.]
MTFQVKSGGFSYNSIKILDNINFELSNGEILCVLGSNGVGKTTLLKCMMGLQKWQCGETLLDGKNINQIPHKEFWKKIAYVPQAKNSAFSFSAIDMVTMGRSAHLGTFSQPTREDEKIALEAMETCGVLWLKDKLCNEMSGGELQMVLIARALAVNPEMLVLDEPESNLDFKNQLIILGIIEKLARKKNISAIVNTHFPSHAIKIGTKTLILNKGAQPIFGNAKEIINEANMRKTFNVQVHINEFDFEDRHYRSVEPLYVLDGSHGKQEY